MAYILAVTSLMYYRDSVGQCLKKCLKQFDLISSAFVNLVDTNLELEILQVRHFYLPQIVFEVSQNNSVVTTQETKPVYHNVTFSAFIILRNHKLPHRMSSILLFSVMFM